MIAISLCVLGGNHGELFVFFPGGGPSSCVVAAAAIFICWLGDNVRMSDRLVVRVLVIYHHQDVAQLEHLLPGRAQIGMTCMSLGRGGLGGGWGDMAT